MRTITHSVVLLSVGVLTALSLAGTGATLFQAAGATGAPPARSDGAPVAHL